jgi:hypothetical protein
LLTGDEHLIAMVLGAVPGQIEDGENRERAALQVLILSVGDGGIISGGAGITYSISYINQNGTQQMMLQEASTYVSNYQDVTLLQGRLHTFLHSWRTVSQRAPG